MTTWAESGVFIGGLMRCCTSSIGEAVEAAPETPCEDGQTIQCRYAPDDPNHRAVMQDGNWRWVGPKKDA